jgi:hypothetical protein
MSEIDDRKGMLMLGARWAVFYLFASWELQLLLESCRRANYKTNFQRFFFQSIPSVNI